MIFPSSSTTTKVHVCGIDRQEVGIKEMEDGIWVVGFMDYDLGYFDEKGTKGAAGF